MTRNEAAWRQAILCAKDDAALRSYLTVAEAWARLMEARLAEGGTLDASLMASTLDEADTLGLSGSLHAGTIQVLERTWVHGADLRALHEKARAKAGEATTDQLTGCSRS